MKCVNKWVQKGTAAKVRIKVYTNSPTNLVKETSTQSHVLWGICGKYRRCLIWAIDSQYSSAKFHYGIWDRNRGNIANVYKAYISPLIVRSFLYLSPCLYVNDEVPDRQTIVDHVDEPWCQISSQHLGEAVGHQLSPGNLAQHTETQSHCWIEMSTYRDK